MRTVASEDKQTDQERGLPRPVSRTPRTQRTYWRHANLHLLYVLPRIAWTIGTNADGDLAGKLQELAAVTLRLASSTSCKQQQPRSQVCAAKHYGWDGGLRGCWCWPGQRCTRPHPVTPRDRLKLCLRIGKDLRSAVDERRQASLLVWQWLNETKGRWRSKWFSNVISSSYCGYTVKIFSRICQLRFIFPPINILQARISLPILSFG